MADDGRIGARHHLTPALGHLLYCQITVREAGGSRNVVRCTVPPALPNTSLGVRISTTAPVGETRIVLNGVYKRRQISQKP